MNEDEYFNLLDLEIIADRAHGACDPLDFFVRQKNLLYKLAAIELTRLYAERKRREDLKEKEP